MRQLHRPRHKVAVASEARREGGELFLRYARTWLGVGTLILTIILVGAGWFLVTLFQSPEQRAADAKPPEREALFAAVTLGTLADTITLQGEIETSNVYEITVPISASDKITVVTAHPIDVGAKLQPGDQVTEANGRPVFLVESPFDLYRDLGVGDSGPDVEQLQETLVKHGLLSKSDGRFGPSTASAVAEWYRENGYEPPMRDELESTPSAEASDGSKAMASKAEQGTTSNEAAAPKIYVPLSEVVTVPLTPVSALNTLPVGSHVGMPEAADIRFGSADLLIRVSGGSRVPAGLSKDAEVNFSGEGFSGTGKFTGAVTVKPGQGEQGASDEVDLVFMPTEEVDSSKIGALVTLRATVNVVSEDALIVPTVALVEDAGGVFRVLRRQQDGSTIEVPVRELGSLNGASAIEVEPGALSVGDQVRVS